MKFEIEKNIPVHGEFAQTCESLEVGESFLAPLHYQHSLSVRTRALRPKRFTSHKVDDENCRIWRVE